MRCMFRTVDVCNLAFASWINETHTGHYFTTKKTNHAIILI